MKTTRRQFVKLAAAGAASLAAPVLAHHTGEQHTHETPKLDLAPKPSIYDLCEWADYMEATNAVFCRMLEQTSERLGLGVLHSVTIRDLLRYGNSFHVADAVITQVRSNLAKRRRDPAHWNVLPFPVEYQTLGSDAAPDALKTSVHPSRIALAYDPLSGETDCVQHGGYYVVGRNDRPRKVTAAHYRCEPLKGVTCEGWGVPWWFMTESPFTSLGDFSVAVLDGQYDQDLRHALLNPEFYNA